jgi:AcrR family transcriptional regulator
MDGTSIVRRPPFGSNPLVGERGSDTQRRILGAALEVFAEVGFNEARVELITKRAGCSRPAFYQYFSSKDDVFWKLAGQLGHDMVDLGDQLGTVTPDAAGVAALARWIDEFTTLYEAYAPVFSAFQAASRNHRPLAQGSSTISDRLGAALLLGFGVDGEDPAEITLAAGVVAVLIRCSFYWGALAGTVERSRLIDGLAQIVHRLFAGPIQGVNIERPKRVPPAPAPAAAPPHPTAPGDENGRALRPRGQKTRQQLLDAGAKVLPARGYHDARVDDIVEVAGVSHGSFYRYFENKEDFFRVLAEEASTRMIELLDVFPADGEADALHAWLDDWFSTYQSNGGVISTWQEMQTADDDLLSFSQHVAESVITRLMGLLERRGFGDPLVDALVLQAIVERMPYSVFTLRFTKRADAIDATVAIVRRGLLGLPQV